MTFNLKQHFLTLLTIVIVLTFIGCSSTAKTSDNVETKTVETADKGNNAETENVPKTTTKKKDGEPDETTKDNSTNLTASSGDKIGVAECDEYIEKYEICLTSKVPETARETLKFSIEQMRKSWKPLPKIRKPK